MKTDHGKRLEMVIGILMVFTWVELQAKPIQNTPPSWKTEDLDRYLGVYSCPLVPLKIVITRNDSGIVAQATGQSAFPLTRTQKNQFEFSPAGVVMAFDSSRKEMVLQQGGGGFPFSSKELIPLPVSENPTMLDFSQAAVVHRFARYFPNNTQLSIGFLTPESEKYVGVLRRNDSLIYVENRDSVFEIGSITKTFTGTMLAKLVYDGKIDPYDPIQKFLPVRLSQASLNGKTIELVHLANHTSGLPFEPSNVKDDQEHPFDPYCPYGHYDIIRLYDYLSRLETLQSTPGETRLYSNLGGGLLGHILTLITQKPYGELLFQTICAPLNMTRTFVTFNEERGRSMVQGRDPEGRPIPFDDGNCGALTGAGGIKSSVTDMMKYLKANLDDTTFFQLAQKTTKRFDEHLTGELGWATYSEYGKHHVGAFGATGGFTSGIIFERNERVGVVVLTNVSAYLVLPGNNTEALCRALYDPLPFIRENKKR